MAASAVPGALIPPTGVKGTILVSSSNSLGWFKITFPPVTTETPSDSVVMLAFSLNLYVFIPDVNPVEFLPIGDELLYRPKLL